MDWDGNLKTKNYLSYVSGCTDRVKTTGRCHIVDNESIKFQAATGYVLCCIDMLIISGGNFGSVKINHKNVA